MALESKKEKDIQEKATAEDMRKKATERVGEARRRHSEENDEITPERKQRRRNSDVIEVLKGSLEMKRKEQEQAGQLRERKLYLWRGIFNAKMSFKGQ